jgi:hypothetical protein
MSSAKRMAGHARRQRSRSIFPETKAQSWRCVALRCVALVALRWHSRAMCETTGFINSRAHHISLPTDGTGAGRVEDGERYDCSCSPALPHRPPPPLRRHLTPSWVLAEAFCCLVLPLFQHALMHTTSALTFALNLNQHLSPQDTLWPSPMTHACGCRLTICGSRFGKRVRLRLPLRACPCATKTKPHSIRGGIKGSHTEGGRC